MFDVIIQVMIALGFPLLVLINKRSGRMINPLSICYVLFFLPLFFCLFRLSSIQASSWTYETYVAMITSFGAWIVLPAIVIFYFSSKTNLSVYGGESVELLKSSSFITLVRSFALIVIAAYTVSNIVQAKSLLPALHPEVAFSIHAEFPFGLRFFARATPVAAILLYLAFWGRRQKIDLLLLFIVFLMPMTRLSRIDPAMTAVGLAAVHSFLPLVRISKSRMLLILALGMAVLVGVAEIGNQRQNRFGVYEFKYSEFIGWKPTVTGPAEIFPVLYGYTSLSFENFNQMVAQFRGQHSVILFSFDWLFSGFIKLNWFTQYNLAQADVLKYSVISNAAAVPTALVPFYADGGAVGMALPMSFYMGMWLFFYLRSGSSFLLLTLYGVYSAAFALSSFQSLIVSGPVAQQLVWAFLIFAIASFAHKRKQSPSLSESVA